MKKFHFRLQTLLKFRKMQEEQAQIRLGQAVHELMTAKKILAEIENELMKNVDIFYDRQKQRLTVDTLKIFQNYFDKLREDIVSQTQKVIVAEQYRQECLQLLEEAAKKYKLVEKLRERHFLKYQEEVLQEEQKYLDELGIQIHSRRA